MFYLFIGLENSKLSLRIFESRLVEQDSCGEVICKLSKESFEVLFPNMFWQGFFLLLEAGFAFSFS